MLPYSDFNDDFFAGRIKELNPEIEIIRLSCKSGQGVEGWIDWIEKNIQR
jgi:hydrogenase nickel incorporation protein HypB